jgi:tetratricopeptide (TPR) repeat protein
MNNCDILKSFILPILLIVVFLPLSAIATLEAVEQTQNHTSMLEVTSFYKKNQTDLLNPSTKLNITSDEYPFLTQQGKEDFRKAITLNDYGRYDEAMTYFDRVLDLVPSYVPALFGKGFAHSNLGQYEQAIIFYDKIISIDENATDAYYNKGLALANLGKYEGAISQYDKGLATEPNSIYILIDKGSALSYLGKEEEAIQVYDKVLAIEPTHTNIPLIQMQFITRGLL